MQGLRLVLGDNDKNFIESMSKILRQKGYNVLSSETSGTALLRSIRRINPDVVIADAELKGMNGFDIAQIVENEWICPCVVLIKGSSSAYFSKLKEKLVYAYLQKPIDVQSVEYVIDNAYFNFKKILELDKKLKERKTVEKAKGLLIERYNISEDKAFEYIRKKSMDNCISLYITSLKIIEAIKKKNLKNV